VLFVWTQLVACDMDRSKFTVARAEAVLGHGPMVATVRRPNSTHRVGSALAQRRALDLSAVLETQWKQEKSSRTSTPSTRLRPVGGFGPPPTTNVEYYAKGRGPPTFMATTAVPSPTRTEPLGSGPAYLTDGQNLWDVQRAIVSCDDVLRRARALNPLPRSRSAISLEDPIFQPQMLGMQRTQSAFAAAPRGFVKLYSHQMSARQQNRMLHTRILRERVEAGRRAAGLAQKPHPLKKKAHDEQDDTNCSGLLPSRYTAGGRRLLNGQEEGGELSAAPADDAHQYPEEEYEGAPGSLVAGRRGHSQSLDDGEDTELRSISLSRDAAMAFLEADIDGDKELTFDEFMSIAPAELKASLRGRTMKELFDRIDRNGNGTISLDEFFIWSLGFISNHTGTGLEAIFRKYDKDGGGVLDAAEFDMVAEDLGFGGISNNLFIELDRNNSGTVSATDLTRYIGGLGSSRDAKRFLTTLAYEDGHVTLDTSSWELAGESADALRKQLLELLETHTPPGSPSDLFRALTGGRGGAIREEHFGHALRRIGMPRGKMWLVQEMYKAMDKDGSGVIGMRDVSMWLKDERGRLSKALAMRMPRPLPRDIDWDIDALRKALQMMMTASGLAPIDLLRAWDQASASGDNGTLERTEFISRVKKAVDDEELWEEEIRHVALHAFKHIAGEDMSIDVVEFETWLHTGWHAIKAGAKYGPQGTRGPSASSSYLLEAGSRPAPLSRERPHASGRMLLGDPWQKERERYKRLRLTNS